MFGSLYGVYQKQSKLDLAYLQDHNFQYASVLREKFASFANVSALFRLPLLVRCTWVRDFYIYIYYIYYILKHVPCQSKKNRIPLFYKFIQPQIRLKIIFKLK